MKLFFRILTILLLLISNSSNASAANCDSQKLTDFIYSCAAGRIEDVKKDIDEMQPYINSSESFLTLLLVENIKHTL